MNAISKWLTLFTLIVWSGCALAQHYTITDLSPVACGLKCRSLAINNSGQVLGTALIPRGAVQAVVYSNGSAQHLGSLPGSLYWHRGWHWHGQHLL
jgi:probable HAF family extracellular repeat protein